MLADVFPYCKGDVVRLEDDVRAEVDKVAKSRDIKKAYEVYQMASTDVDTAVGDVEADLTKLKRAALNAKAVDAGVENPEALPTKQAVVDAINASQPAAA